jgi:gas vesicle protein
MQRLLRSMLAALLALGAGGALAACGDDDDSDVDDSVEDVVDDVDEGVEDVGDEVEDVEDDLTDDDE